MLKNCDIIVFSDDWGRHPFSCQHIMKHLVPYNRIIWVNTIGMRKPKINVNDIQRGLQKIWSWTKTKQDEVEVEGLTIISPFMIPFSSIPIVRVFNRYSVIKSVNKIYEKMKFKKPILLTTLPNAGDYVGSFDEFATIYYCVDDFIRWPGVYESVVREQEALLLNKIDLLICSSEELAKIKITKADVRILSHGVDYQHFSTLPSVVSKSSLIKDISRPIAGYFGLFGAWIDLDLLEKTIKRYSNVSFVLIGNVVVNIERLQGYSNVHFIGSVPYNDLPDFISFMDVLILPYSTEDRGQTITPLKLREYIATGKPVVTTSIPECKLYEQYLYIAESHELFCESLGIALLSSKTSPDEQKMAVEGEDWLHKAEYFSDMIGEILDRK